MNTMEPNSIEGVLGSINEAIEFLDCEGRSHSPQFTYLFDDVKYGLEVLKNSSFFENNDGFPEYTDQLIKIIDLFKQDITIDFTIIKDAFASWELSITFDIAEIYFQKNDYTMASEYYGNLINSNNLDYQSMAFHRLGQINSITNPMKSYEMYTKAFEVNKTISKYILSSDHPSHNYIYEAVEENYQNQCPFCQKESKPYFCAEAYRGLSYNKIYSPVKVWMYCDSCEHIFAYNTTAFLSDLKFDGVNSVRMPFKFTFLPTIGENLKKIKRYSPGNMLLDVGVGGGELLATAKELLFNVEGLEIVKNQADHVAKLLGIDVYSCDFLKYQSEKRYDVITMGDVIEHIENPIDVVQKAYDLLSDQGVFWISTPNFHSAFSQFSKFKDPMWVEAGHLQYFSYDSIKTLLENYNFQIVDYNISHHYRGSMEITAIKKAVE